MNETGDIYTSRNGVSGIVQCVCLVFSLKRGPQCDNCNCQNMTMVCRGFSLLRLFLKLLSILLEVLLFTYLWRGMTTGC